MILGLDISTSCIGYALFSNDGKLMKIGHVKMNSKQSLFQRLLLFEEHMKEISTLKVEHISIEEPLKKFTGKFSSAQTIAVLNQFNGMVSAICHKIWKIEPAYYNVSTARKTAFPNVKFGRKSSESKVQVWEEVSKLEPQLNWKYGPKSRKLVDENYDMCDAYCVGLCHINILKRQKSKIT